MAQSRTRIRRLNGTGPIIESITDSTRGPGSCDHTIIRPATGDVFAAGGVFGPYVPTAFEIASITRTNEWYRTILWSSLPTSSQFNLIASAVELQDTIEMFFLNFWTNLNYGSFTWGVLPFISDVQAIITVVKSFHTALQSYTISDITSHTLDDVTFKYNYGGWLRHELFDAKVKVRLRGFVDFAKINPVLQRLDQLGFHPDLGTIWDLTPYSFLIDYFLPIGELLTVYRGWVSNIPFKGYASSVETFSFRERVSFPSSPTAPATSTNIGTFRRYQRHKGSFSLVAPPADLSISLNAPSPKQIFNLVYVAATSLL